MSSRPQGIYDPQTGGATPPLQRIHRQSVGDVHERPASPTRKRAIRESPLLLTTHKRRGNKQSSTTVVVPLPLHKGALFCLPTTCHFLANTVIVITNAKYGIPFSRYAVFFKLLLWARLPCSLFLFGDPRRLGGDLVIDLAHGGGIDLLHLAVVGHKAVDLLLDVRHLRVDSAAKPLRDQGL